MSTGVFPSTDYLNTAIAVAAVAKLDDPHHYEHDVERVLTILLEMYFPTSEGFTKVPQYMVPEGKRPDRLVELFDGEAGFKPVLVIELKRQKGDSIKKATMQMASSTAQLIDNREEIYEKDDFTIFKMIVKGRQVAFFQYQNDRSNLSEDGIDHFRGCTAFNDDVYTDVDTRPMYKGTRGFDYGENEEDRNPDGDWGKMKDLCFDIKEDALKVGEILAWMSVNKPYSLT